MVIHILTRCTRTKFLLNIKDRIAENKTSIQSVWHIIFDTSVHKDIDASLLNELSEFGAKIHFYNGKDGDFGHQLLNRVIEIIKDGWVYILDDDNQLHPNFFVRIEEILSQTNKRAIVFNQRIDGKDFTGQEMRWARPENMATSKVDSAQYLLSREVIGDIRLNEGNYIADSIWIEQIWKVRSEEFYFLDEELCYYNYFSQGMKARLPKIILYSDEALELKSQKKLWFESDELTTIHLEKPNTGDIIDIDPDFIISVDKQEDLPSYLESKHIKVNRDFDGLGNLAYNAAMTNILDRDNKDMVSFFTPIYNTGDRLLKLWDSIKIQTHANWEWIIVNDSTDSGKTLKIAEAIASTDPRVKIYDFRKKSGGIIGESKYRAAMLCNGSILAEIDHDDWIMPDSAKLLVEAFKQHPDAGFAYTDCVEILDDFRTTLQYPAGFCFGYGKYRQEEHLGIIMNVNESPNINPKTIRHIVGIPNHIRAWKREVYLQLGGHNRRLSIADDYELVLRTFLITKFVRIRKNCYLQFIYRTQNSSNTHDLARADIQRRVRTIQEYYNFSIFKRFEELGILDWAYLTNQSNPLSAPSRHGEDEGKVNYDYIDS